MARMAVLALLIVAAVCAVARAGDIPSMEVCEMKSLSMDANDFVARALGGRAGCVDAQDKTDCCEEIRGLFGEGGSAELCMCNEDYLSQLLMGLPGSQNVDPTRYTDMLEECDVPVAGKMTCPGTEEETEVEPKVQGQIVKKLILAKILKKAALAKALKKKPKRAPPADIAPAVVVPPPPPPVVEPIPHGKKAVKTVVVAPVHHKG